MRHFNLLPDHFVQFLVVTLRHNLVGLLECLELFLEQLVFVLQLVDFFEVARIDFLRAELRVAAALLGERNFVLEVLELNIGLFEPLVYLALLEFDIHVVFCHLVVALLLFFLRHLRVGLHLALGAVQ